MVQWFKKYDLYCIFIIFILGIFILLISWFYYVDLRDFLLFLASILIATSSYMILLINSIKQRKREERRRKREDIRKRKRKIRKVKRVYKAIRDLILSLQKRSYEKSISPSSISPPIDVFLGGRIFDLNKKKKYLKLLNCRIDDNNLEIFYIDKIEIEMKML